MKKAIIVIIAFMAILSMGTTSCKKDKNSTTATGKFYLHLHTNVDTNEVDDYGTVYTTSTGRKISVDIAQMYISHIQLIRTDGTIYSVPDTVLLKKMEQEAYYVGDVPVASYKAVQFYVGLDASAYTAGSTNPAFGDNSMWFGSTAQATGFKFINFQGKIDTTTAANGPEAQMQSFMYEIGTSAHLVTITMPDHSPTFDVNATSATYAHIIIDYAKLMDGIKINNSSNLMVMSLTDNSGALADSIAARIPSMFTYEE